MAVDLVLDRSKERPTVIDECNDIGGGVIITISFDQFASDFEYRFVRKQIFIQISGLYLVFPSFLVLLESLGKIFDVFNSVIESSSTGGSNTCK